MTRRRDLSRLSLRELAALAERAESAGSFALQLQRDPRAGARALGERLARKLRRISTERARQGERLVLEEACWARGRSRVAGVDEAGMGPLAGPVVAAAVILDPSAPILEANDSKQLGRAERERLEPLIKARSLAWAVASSSVAEIAATDIHRAGLEAMRRAVAQLHPAPQHLLVDARVLPDMPMSQEAHVKGDARSCSIAAASILAKVERDRLMRALAVRHPGYGFEIHAGYGTPDHLEALRRLGPCEAHRLSWRALADHAGQLSPAYYELKAGLQQVLAEGAERAAGGEPLEAWRRRVQSRLFELSADELERLDAMARRAQRAAASSRTRGARSTARSRGSGPRLQAT